VKIIKLSAIVANSLLSWSAIVRGAVAKGLEGDGRTPIKNRKARRSYGTDCYRNFVSGVNQEIDSFHCPYTGAKSARNQMSWLVSKGQNLSTLKDAHSKVHFVQHFWERDGKRASLDLLASDADMPPSRCTAKV
jgi:hypothetical protein